MTTKSFAAVSPPRSKPRTTSRSSAEAGDADEALDGIRDARPDVAVLDVRLGEGNGIDVCRQITSEFPEVKC
jgi:DNA-binding NarL/FixJ family response regulator